jgi:hypothetical protein
VKKFKEIAIVNPERFLSKISIDKDGCWIHSGSRDQDGYVIIRDIGQYKAHRYSYALFNKGLSNELVIDHKCRNRACCNPDHLRAVTTNTNVTENRCNMLIDYCKKGHMLTIENKASHKSKGGYVTVCRECARIKNRKIRYDDSTRDKRLARRRELKILKKELINV